MRKTLFLIATLLILSVLLIGCGGSGDTGGDAGSSAGKDLFAQTVIGSQAGILVGPTAELGHYHQGDPGHVFFQVAVESGQTSAEVFHQPGHLAVLYSLGKVGVPAA